MSVFLRDKVFPHNFGKDSTELAAKIAGALHEDFGEERSAIKNICKLARTNPRSAKNWYRGSNTPSLLNFLKLAKSSPCLIKLMMEEIGGHDLRDAFELLGEKTVPVSKQKIRAKDNYKSAKSCTFIIILPNRIARRLNIRQLWILSELEQGRYGVKGPDIASAWGVSARTAKYDLAILVKMQLLVSRGSGHDAAYHLTKERMEL